MKDFANVLTATAAGIMAGFLALPPLAAVVDRVEEARCPGRTRIPMVAVGTDWGKWGACPSHITSLPS
jgi:hypothetical protein